VIVVFSIQGEAGYNDSDWDGDVNGRKSTSGLIFFLNDSANSWQSTK
jgi:hypothetical protein